MVNKTVKVVAVVGGGLLLLPYLVGGSEERKVFSGGGGGSGLFGLGDLSNPNSTSPTRTDGYQLPQVVIQESALALPTDSSGVGLSDNGSKKTSRRSLLPDETGEVFRVSDRLQGYSTAFPQADDITVKKKSTNLPTSNLNNITKGAEPKKKQNIIDRTATKYENKINKFFGRFT